MSRRFHKLLLLIALVVPMIGHAQYGYTRFTGTGPTTIGFNNTMTQFPASFTSTRTIGSFNPIPGSYGGYIRPMNPMIPYFPPAYTPPNPPAAAPPTSSGSGSGYFAISKPANPSKAQPANQTVLQVETIRLNDAGSKLNAGIGIVTCAEAMNTLRDDQSTGGVLLESCVNSFKASSQMKEAEQLARANINAHGNPELGFSEDVVNSAKGAEIFNDLEEKYGVSKIEFTEIVLASRGRPSVLASNKFLQEVSGGKMSQEMVLMGFAEASKMSQEEKDKVLAESRTAGLADQFAVDLSKSTQYLSMNRSAQAPQSVRRFLQENKHKVEAIEEKVKADSAMGIREPASKPMFREHLTPIDSDPFLAEVAQSRENIGAALASNREEGSLFQMVHSKYKEKSHLLSR